MTAFYPDLSNTVSKKRGEEELNIADFPQTLIAGQQDGNFKPGQTFRTPRQTHLENVGKGGISNQIKHMDNENMLASVAVIITCFSMHRLDSMALVGTSNFDSCSASLNYIYGSLSILIIAVGTCVAAFIFLLNWKSLSTLSPPCTEIMIWKFTVFRKKTHVIRNWMIRLVLVIAVCFLISFCMNPYFWCKHKWVGICATILVLVVIFLLFLWYQDADRLCRGVCQRKMEGSTTAMKWDEVFPCCIDIFECLRKKRLMSHGQLNEEWINSDADVCSWSQSSSARKIDFPEMGHRNSVSEQKHREVLQQKIPRERKVRDHNIHQKNKVPAEKQGGKVKPNLHRQSVVVDSPGFREAQNIRHVYNHQQAVNPKRSKDFNKKDAGSARKKLQFRIRKNLKNHRYIGSNASTERDFFEQTQGKPYTDARFDNRVAYEPSRHQYQNIIENPSIENYQRMSSMSGTNASESDTLLKIREEEEEEIAKRIEKKVVKGWEGRASKQPAILSRNVNDEIVAPGSFSGKRRDDTRNYPDMPQNATHRRNPNSQIIWEEKSSELEINSKRDLILENLNRRTQASPVDANRNTDQVTSPKGEMRIYLDNPNRTSYSSVVNLSPKEHQIGNKGKCRSKPAVVELQMKASEISTDTDDSKKILSVPSLNLHESNNERKSSSSYKQRLSKESKVHAVPSSRRCVLLRTDTSTIWEQKTKKKDLQKSVRGARRSRSPPREDNISRRRDIQQEIDENFSADSTMSHSSTTEKSPLLDSKEREILLNSDSETNTVVSLGRQSGSGSGETSSTVSDSRSEEVIDSLHQMFSNAKSALDTIVSKSDPGSDIAENTRALKHHPEEDMHNSQKRISNYKEIRGAASSTISNMARSNPITDLSSSQVSTNLTYRTMIELSGTELSDSGAYFMNYSGCR